MGLLGPHQGRRALVVKHYSFIPIAIGPILAGIGRRICRGICLVIAFVIGRVLFSALSFASFLFSF